MVGGVGEELNERREESNLSKYIVCMKFSITRMKYCLKK